MSPKEKAILLLHRFAMILSIDMSEAAKKHALTLDLDGFAKFVHDETEHIHLVGKKCALQCVDEIITENTDNVVLMDNSEQDGINNDEYWKLVKEEINKL